MGRVKQQKPQVMGKEPFAEAYHDLFKKAYALMDEPVIEGNCGELCGFHCCRPASPTEGRLGMYLLPLEFEYMQQDKGLDFEMHHSRQYDMPPKIKKLYYIFCGEATGCLREHRPVQCRTYPFEPHLEDGELTLVIEKEQIHLCPLLSRQSEWRKAYLDGIYEGWLELMKIPLIRYYTSYYTAERIKNQNIAARYGRTGWMTI